MITVDKQELINLIQSFIRQGADDQINFGHSLNPEEYIESIELQLNQIEIIIHNDLNQDCNCDMCNHYKDYTNHIDSQNENDLNSFESQTYE